MKTKNILSILLFLLILVAKLHGQCTWTPLGPNDDNYPSIGLAELTSIVIDTNGIPFIVYKDGVYGGKATVVKYNGNKWNYVGSPGFTTASILEISMALDASSTPYVAFPDIPNGNKTSVMKFNGTNWINVGSPAFSVGPPQHISIAVDAGGTPYVLYRDFGIGGVATVKKFDGTNWISVGSPSVSSAGTFFTNL